MKKKLLAILLTLAMVLSLTMVSAMAANTPVVSVETAASEMKAGDEVSLQVSIANNPGFTNYEWHIQYDKARLELKSIEGSVLSVSNINHSRTGYGYANYAAATTNTANGDLFTLTFVVKNDAAPGFAEVKIVADKFSNIGQAITANYVPGGITIIGSSTGDSTTGGSSTGDSTTGSSTAGSSTTGSSTTGSSTTGSSTTGSSTTGSSTTGSSTTGSSTTGSSTTGSSTTGSSTTGSSTTGGSTTGSSSTSGSETNPQTISGPDTITMRYGDTNANIGASAPGTLHYTVNAGSEGFLSVDANGNLTAKAVGTACVTVSADATAKYDAATKDVTVKISPKLIAAPAADTATYTYNGKAQTYTIAASADYTVTNDTQTNANDYTVTVALVDKANTVWADTQGTTDKTFPFTIAKAPLTIKADDKAAYVGDKAPALTFTEKGLIGSDTLTKAPTASYASTPDMSKTGTVKINVSGAEAPNYAINYESGTLTITNRSTGGGGGGGGGGGFVAQTYDIVVKTADNGTVKADRSSAASGTTIDLAVTPKQGWTLETLTAADANGKEVALTIVKAGETYTFKMPSSKVTVTATFMEDNTILNYFVDVPTSSYYYDAVLWAVEKGVTKGTDDSHFSPDGTCTRAQAVTFLWRAAGSPAPTSTTTAFTDVPSGAYYYDAVLWAVENGITKGTTDAAFSPDATCSRSQIVTFLYRAMKSPEARTADPFTDVKSDDYYADAVLWAVEKGITTGTSATTFSPNDDCTRAQIVTFLYRAMK